MRRAVIRSGLETLYFTGAHHALSSIFGGVGAILTMHHVRPARHGEFQPNRLLEVTPEFLDAVIEDLRRSGVELIALDELHRRLAARAFGKRFVCLTFDDGYRDNREFAYPVLKRHGVPFAIYIPTSFPEGRGDLWWLTLETVIAGNDRIELAMGEGAREFACRTAAEKYLTYETVYWWLRSLKDEDEMRAVVAGLAARYAPQASARNADLCMSWNEIAELAADPLVTLGAHTVNHVMLRKASDAAAREEMAASAAEIARRLGVRPLHLSYPVGDATSAGPREFAIARELGFKTAVTTRPGVLFPEHADYLTALPRISLNGEFQRRRYAKVLTSGAATALWNRVRRVDAA